MNHLIGEILAEQFIELDIVSRSAGVVRALPKTKDITIPVTSKIFRADGAAYICEQDADYYELIPKTKELGILYFEEIGDAKVIDSNSRYNTFQGEITLVYWSNTKLSTLSPVQIDNILNNFLPKDIPQSQYVIGGKINWSGTKPRTATIFKKYKYDEARTKFLSPPYVHIIKTVKFKVMVSRNCPINYDVKIDEEC